MISQRMQKLSAITATLLAAALSGCGIGAHSTATGPVAGALFQGVVHGGQQPISGAAIYLYAVGATGYGSASTNLLKSAVTTTSSGTFTLTSAYTCPSAGTQVYLAAVGGNSGGSQDNGQSTLLAVLGDCGNLTSSTFIWINEVTTVASVFALAPFMSSYSAIGSTASNANGIQMASVSAGKLVNTSTGTAPGLTTGAVVPSAEVYSLANLIANCVNSNGGVSGDGSTCGTLFQTVTPSGGTVPTDTAGALLLIARNPALNVATLYNSIPATSPFAPSLTAAPKDWTLSINYTFATNTNPFTTTMDTAGYVWILFGSGPAYQKSLLTPTNAITYPGGGGSANGNTTAITIDAAGAAWIAYGSATISAANYVISPEHPLAVYPLGGVPTALASDAQGYIWATTSGDNKLYQLEGYNLASPGTIDSTASTGTAATSLVVNPF